MKAMRHHRIIGLLAVALVCGIGIARADTVTATWTNPTTNTNASAIPATGAGSLDGAKLEYGTCSAPGVFGTKAGEVVRARGTGAQPSTASVNLQPGTSCLRVVVYNTFGNTSSPSNVTVSVVPAPTPSPPTNLTVSDPVAYDVRPNEQTFAFDRGRPVGLAKLGAACDEARTTGGDFYALERPSRVKLNRQPRSAALVARCASGT
jgi:hypothetical protein